jgi:hypothetical protein
METSATQVKTSSPRSEKLKIWVGEDTKRHAFLIASAKGMSISELFEYLIEHGQEILDRERATRQ